jgi:hypothetical protein
MRIWALNTLPDDDRYPVGIENFVQIPMYVHVIFSSVCMYVTPVVLSTLHVKVDAVNSFKYCQAAKIELTGGDSYSAKLVQCSWTSKKIGWYGTLTFQLKTKSRKTIFWPTSEDSFLNQEWCHIGIFKVTFLFTLQWPIPIFPFTISSSTFVDMN